VLVVLNLVKLSQAFAELSHALAKPYAGDFTLAELSTGYLESY